MGLSRRKRVCCVVCACEFLMGKGWMGLGDTMRHALGAKGNKY